MVRQVAADRLEAGSHNSPCVLGNESGARWCRDAAEVEAFLADVDPLARRHLAAADYQPGRWL